jgi:hypothetical protein
MGGFATVNFRAWMCLDRTFGSTLVLAEGRPITSGGPSQKGRHESKRSG